MTKFSKFILSLALVAITALLSSYFTYNGINTFYSNLSMPALTPPNFVFSIVWPILYALMIVSFYLILNENNNQSAVNLFSAQLILHILWTYVFFTLGYFMLGLLVLIMLVLNVLWMIKKFYGLNHLASYLQYPYLIWLLFATYLNIGIVYFNGYTLP